ncbi:hypothetical protein DHW03_09480 [Pedobacter yonginense]|uniref:Uncharacterized protein n=1 Tax=Pedobacter yonginense TaxID=651869 RepID=A0A317ERM1_9SPHI|nr:hypothetical protein [Pedobacter yonginense]PWS27798.1 hypothetical protein DHW03_09480 [Pedobacter yonginense]
MNQIDFQDNILMLKVGKSSLIVRLILVPVTLLFFLLPIWGLSLNLADGQGIKFLSVLIFAGYFLLGFYLLRICLWNTFGKEVISFGLNTITYEADYGWFKGNKKEIPLENSVCKIKPSEFENQGKGILVFESDQSEIECVALVPLEKLQVLFTHIQDKIAAIKPEEFQN